MKRRRDNHGRFAAEKLNLSFSIKVLLVWFAFTSFACGFFGGFLGALVGLKRF